MKNRLLTLAGALALLVVLGRFYAVPVYAQVKAALVQSRDEKARNPYQARINVLGAGGTSTTTFPFVPAGKRLVIEHVSVLIRGAFADTIDSAYLSGNQAGAFQFTPGVYTQTGGGAYVINQGVLEYFDAGDTPTFNVSSSSANPFTTIATISGYTIDIP
jgi:hypothetical protein